MLKHVLVDNIPGKDVRNEFRRIGNSFGYCLGELTIGFIRPKGIETYYPEVDDSRIIDALKAHAMNYPGVTVTVYDA